MYFKKRNAQFVYKKQILFVLTILKNYYYTIKKSNKQIKNFGFTPKFLLPIKV